MPLVAPARYRASDDLLPARLHAHRMEPGADVITPDYSGALAYAPEFLRWATAGDADDRAEVATPIGAWRHSAYVVGRLSLVFGAATVAAVVALARLADAPDWDDIDEAEWAARRAAVAAEHGRSLAWIARQERAIWRVLYRRYYSRGGRRATGRASEPAPAAAAPVPEPVPEPVAV